MKRRIIASIITFTMIISTFMVSGVYAAAETSTGTPPDIVSLLSPDYHADIDGVTDLKISAPGGYTEAYAYYTDAPDESNPHPLGHTVTVGPAKLDKNGIGTITIDCNEIPNGPIMIKVEAFKEDGTSCDGYFQFFNKDGEEWNAGLTGRNESIQGHYDPEIALPEFVNQHQKELGRPALRTVYADDMNYKDNKDLKAHISRSGIGKTYGGHYPNHKDDRMGFQGPEYGDERGQSYNPYRAVQGKSDSYLLMIDKKQDVAINGDGWGGITKYMTSPCLSSISEEGHSASLPEYPNWDGWTNGYTEQYMEARIYFGPNPGTWPSFWTLSNGPYKDPKTDEFRGDDSSGGRTGWRGTDELDIIEAWHTTNTFSINTHAWGYNPISRTDETYGGGIKGFTSMQVMEDAGTDALVGDFHMGFFVYGCYITKERTYYFLNNQLVGSEPTGPMSYRDGNRFLLNTGLDSTKHQAYPAGYGFERYGNENYTYVDWIRMWEAPNDPSEPIFDVEYDMVELQEINPGDKLTFKMNRVNDAAKKAKVTYEIDLPEGWKLDGKNTFPALKGRKYQDEITIDIPVSYTDYSEVINITPVVDGKEYSPTFIKTQNVDDSFSIDYVYPYYNAEKDQYDVYVKVTNSEDAPQTTSAGKIILMDNVHGDVQSIEFPVLKRGESYVLPPFENVEMTKEKTKDYTLKLVRDDGFERIVARKFSGLVAFKTEDFDFGEDGKKFDESQWAGGMEVEIGAEGYEGGVSLSGDEDLHVKLYTKWSDNNLYLAAVVNDDDSVISNADSFGGLWEADSFQISFDPTRYMGYANDLGIEHIRLTGGINSMGVSGFGVETSLYNGMTGDKIKTNCYRDNNAKMTYYMMAIPWKALLPDGKPVIDEENHFAEDLGISIVVNDRDGADSRCWIRYNNGIAAGKHPEQFGDLILTEATTYVPQEKPSSTPAPTQKPEVSGEPSPTSEPSSDAKFVDVKDDDWFHDAVYYAVEKGLFNGTSENEFSPDVAMTRAMFVTVLYRMDKSEEAKLPNPFEDVPEDEYYADAVKWAVDKGIVKGTSEVTFDPDTPISRQDISVILDRYIGYRAKTFDELPVSEPETSSPEGDYYKLLGEKFKDAKQISDYAVSSVLLMNNLGIINGFEDDTVKPFNNATRAEVATMLKRFLEK